jgi:hypothetical protein
MAGTGLFSDDLSLDIRDHYRELLERGVDDADATRQTLDKYQAYLEEDGGVALIALAVTQSTLGRLDADVRDRALVLIDAGATLAVWAADSPALLSRRRAVLAKARAQLTGVQPARKRVRPPRRKLCGLAAGDVLALAVPRGMSLLRVVRVRPHRLGDTPVLEELDHDGPDVPSRETLERLEPSRARLTAMHAPASDSRVFAFVMQGIGWERAGFHKLAPIAVRAGDAEAPMPASGVSWVQLAERLRRRALTAQ